MNRYTFDQVVYISSIRNLFVDIILNFFKQKKLKCFIYGGYIRDEITLLYACKQSNIGKKLKEFLCNKFSRTNKFDIDVNIQILDHEFEFNDLTTKLFDILTTHLKFYNLGKSKDILSELQIKKTRNYNYIDKSETEIFEFVLEGVKFGIDIVNCKPKNISLVDFWLNCLAYDINKELIIRPGIKIENSNINTILDICLDIIECTARPGDNINLPLNDNYKFKKNGNLCKDPINDHKKFVKAFNRLDKMRSYGFIIPNNEDYPKRIASGIICCEKSRTVNLPKYCDKESFNCYCLNCCTSTIKTQDFNISRDNYLNCVIITQKN